MSENLIDELISDSNYKTSYNTEYISSQGVQQDNDSTSSFLNLIDQEILTNNQMLCDNYSPNFNMPECTKNSNDQLAKPDVKSNGLDQSFEELLLTKLPQIVAIERASIQFQVIDQNHQSLSKSFQNCFNSPVLDLLVVVLDPKQLVSFFQGLMRNLSDSSFAHWSFNQGQLSKSVLHLLLNRIAIIMTNFIVRYFAGIPRLTNELIDLTDKYWKSLISNNDDTAWENHFKSVNEKNNLKNNFESEFEAGPVIRCRLRASSSSQFNQQYNYFFVQPCSYMIQLPSNHFNPSAVDYNTMDVKTSGMNNYLVSYINIVRECDTEYALKGSAAASLQKVITNSTFKQRQKVDNVIDLPTSKQTSNRNFRRNIHNNQVAINNQLSVNISSPAYPNIEQSPLSGSAPLTYPLINNPRTDQYNKSNIFTNAQMQHQISQQRQLSMPMNHNQYMTRGTSLSNVDPNQHRYSGPYETSHPSSLQYILENRNNAYPNVKQLANPTHLMGQHGQMYKNQLQPNHTYFLPAAQSGQQTCSLNSPNSFMPSRHVIQMPSNSILMSSDQYFRSGHQINMMDSVQVAQPMMTVQPMSAASNHSPANYYYSTAPNQILHNPLHINTSLTNQSQFVSSSVSPYCNPDRTQMTHQDYPSTPRNNPQPTIKQENYEMNICQNDWLSNSVLDSRNPSLMSNNSISIDIVEEILQAEEAKFENKSLEIEAVKSDSSDSLMGYLNEFMSTTNNKNNNNNNSSSNNNNSNNTTSTTATPPISTHNLPVSATSPQLLNLDVVKSENKLSEFMCNKSSTNKINNSQMLYPISNLKEEILKNLDNSQRLQIKRIVGLYKARKIHKSTMLQQIGDFLSQALGTQAYKQHVMKFWSAQKQYPLPENVDSSLTGFNYSSVVQSPEEGPGISPTEQAAQSTTDLEEDKEHPSKTHTSKYKEKISSDASKRLVRSKSTTKNSEASIYSITSTTSTGVLETLLNEHDNTIISDKNTSTAVSNNMTNSKLPMSSTSKNQLSLDQLLMDDELPIFPNTDEKVTKKTTESMPTRNNNTKIIKSQPSTPVVSNSMGVLETLLNQKTPSMCTLRQMSTENILKHSIPSRQNSSDIFMEDSSYSFESNDKDKGLKKNSLLITLLNTSQNPEKGKMLNSSSSMEGSSPNYQTKRSRMSSGTQSMLDNCNSNKKNEDKLVSPEVDVFDFVDTEIGFGATDTQSTVVTSSQSLCTRKRAQTKRTRKRRYSKDRSIDSDESSDRLSSLGDKYMKNSSVGSVKAEDKNVILTSLLENKKPRSILTPSTPGKVPVNLEKSDNEYTTQVMLYENPADHDDNLDLEDIKIDDFDLENLIDISENFGESNPVEISASVDQSIGAVNIHQSNNDPSSLVNKSIVTNSNISGVASFDVMPPVYKMVGPVIKSDPIVPMSKQSVLRVSDKNSILLSAIQSTSTSNSISFECLDNERERLLRQQQQQKVCMGGDKPPITMGHQLSLDMLSKQMKEVGPNVMVELSVPSEIPRSRKGSISRSQSGISTISPTCNPPNLMSTSPTCRSSYQSSSSTEISMDNAKVPHIIANQVNHQQVREGLRLLVSSRSAQNISKNNMQINRANSGNLNEIAPQNEIPSTPKTCVKDVLHYPSSIQSNNSNKDPSYPYSNQSYGSNVNNTSDFKTADILEDSLVNDVFGLEELVNSKSRHSSANLEYSRLNIQETISADLQIESSTFPVGGCQQSTPGNNSFAQSKPPHHHHHYTHHYHHHHQHHHHHPVANSQPINDSNITTSKEKQNVNSGLLETLLSR